MNRTGIEYLDYTWNPIAMRCTPASPGCASCWHLRTADRLCMNPALPEEERAALAGTGPFVLRERELSAPFSLKKPAVIGVQFMGDLFHEKVPDDFIAETYSVMLGCDRHTYLILSKRPAEMLQYHKGWTLPGYVNPNHVYHGLTVCNQEEWDRLGPIFMQVPGKKFISHEPALGPIDYGSYLDCQKPDTALCPYPCDPCDDEHPCSYHGISCLISGGETGPGARPTHPDVFRSDRDQCAAAGVPYFHKQNGEWITKEKSSPSDEIYPRFTKTHCWNPEGIPPYPFYRDWAYRVGKKRAGRLLDGKEHNELPWR